MEQSAINLNPSLGKKYSEFSTGEETVKLDYDAGELLIYANSDVEKNLRANSCQKEPRTINWIHEFFKPGDIIFDIGANNGCYSLVAAKFLDQNCEIYSFEPAWFNFMQLNRNTRLNGFEKCIYPMCIALSNKTGIEWFHYTSEEIGSAFHTIGEPVDQFGQIFKPVVSAPVGAITLDEFVEQSGKVPTHIKVDVDGAEALVFEGGKRTLGSDQVKSILMELNLNSNNDKEILRDLNILGFSIYEKADKKGQAGELGLTDIVFHRK